MIPLGLTAAERRILFDTLQTGYRARTRLTVLDRDEAEIAVLPHQVLSGSVDVKSGQKPDRVLQLELADDGSRFRFTPEAVSDAAMFADNFIRAERGVYVPALARWVDVPVFTGPVASVARSGHTISVTATGKESRALAPAVAWQPPGPFGRDRRVTDVIRLIMAAQGERHFDLPNMNATTRHQISLGRQSESWLVALRLAASVDRQLFYDGRGVLRMRAKPRRPVWTFRAGDEQANVLTDPKRTYEIADLRNVVEVLGREPEGNTARPRAVAMARRGNPLSPWGLARRGEPLFLVETIEVTNNRREALERIAERELDERLRAAVHVEFESVPVPVLEPRDLVALLVEGERLAFHLGEYTIPLTGESMTIGFNRRPQKRGRR